MWCKFHHWDVRRVLLLYLFKWQFFPRYLIENNLPFYRSFRPDGKNVKYGSFVDEKAAGSYDLHSNQESLNRTEERNQGSSNHPNTFSLVLNYSLDFPLQVWSIFGENVFFSFKNNDQNLRAWIKFLHIGRQPS